MKNTVFCPEQVPIDNTFSCDNIVQCSQASISYLKSCNNPAKAKTSSEPMKIILLFLAWGEFRTQESYLTVFHPGKV
jgi:hypothetical protein